MVCVRCKKRTAVVFIQRMDNGKPVQEGYCLTCAREMHIQPVDDLMKQFGMSDQDLENMEERMSSFLQEAAESGMLPTAAGEDAPEEGDSQDDFVPGGSPVFPFGFGAARQSGDDKAKGKNGKKDKAPKRKFLDTYCENLTQKARDGKRHQLIVHHLSHDPVGGGFHARWLRAGKPRPVAVVAQRVGLIEIGRVAIGIQRLQAAILAEQRRAG